MKKYLEKVANKALEKSAVSPISTAEETAIQQGFKQEQDPSRWRTPTLYKRYSSKYGRNISPYQGLFEIYGPKTNQVLRNARQYRREYPQRLEGFREGSLKWEDLLKKRPIQKLPQGDEFRDTGRPVRGRYYPDSGAIGLSDVYEPTSLDSRFTLSEELGHARQFDKYNFNRLSRLLFSPAIQQEDIPAGNLRQSFDNRLKNRLKSDYYKKLINNYTFTPIELPQKLSSIRRIYQHYHPREEIKTPEDFERAWKWVNKYHSSRQGILEKTSPEWWKKNAPNTYRKLIEAGPGLVKGPGRERKTT